MEQSARATDNVRRDQEENKNQEMRGKAEEAPKESEKLQGGTGKSAGEKVNLTARACPSKIESRKNRPSIRACDRLISTRKSISHNQKGGLYEPLL
jgi:hypothetical protein